MNSPLPVLPMASLPLRLANSRALPLPLLLVVGLSLAASALAGGEKRPPTKQFLAFADESFLTMPVGTFEPEKGWIPFTERYVPYAQGSVFTLYGLGEVLGTVTNREALRHPKGEPPIYWSAAISTWTPRGEPYALAVAGLRPLVEDPATELALNDPPLEALTARALAQVHLPVTQPLITQAFAIHLDSTHYAKVVCAHSDASRLKDGNAAPVYALAFVQLEGMSKALVLAKQVSFKPKSHSVADHEHSYGTRDFYRFISAVDIDGDGRTELVLYKAKTGATEIDVFSFTGKNFKKVLAAFKDYAIR